MVASNSFTVYLQRAVVSVGTLMGITNGIATIPGFVTPAVVGAFTEGNVRNSYSLAMYVQDCSGPPQI